MTQSELKKLFTYEPITGEFTYNKLKISQGRTNKKAGKIAGYKHGNGYLRVGINNKKYFLHRLAALYMLGYIPEEVDHDNHIRDDNRWLNLNMSSRKENVKNKTISSRNTSGHTGVTFCKNTNKWKSQIKIPGGKVTVLGLFDDINDAISEREKANIKYGFNKNHGK